MTATCAGRLLCAFALGLALWTAPAASGAEPPRIITRAQWGADESLRFNAARQEIRPRTFWPVQKIIVHHTETQNYDPNPASTIRAIYRDDARLEGLGDIAYNFLIDEQGRVYEGRYSRPYLAGETPTGEDQLGQGVAAAHAYGYNSGTVGIALLGSLNALDATQRARASLEKLVAWIAARHKIDPLGAVRFVDPVTGATSVFPNVAGHRDVNATECPGAAFYVTLPAIRADVAALIAGRPVPARPSVRPRRAGIARSVRRRLRRENRAIERVRRRQPVVFSGGGRRREVALTFHDGPGPFTPQVVGELRRLRAAATFFHIGKSLIYFSDEAVAASGQGFAIGNKTETYASLTRLSRAAQRREVRGQAARLRSLGIPAPKILTPPYGAYDRATLSVMRRLRMLMVSWSVDSRDTEAIGANAIARNVLRRVRPGAIVLMHDGGGDRTQTVQALPAIVNGLRKRGYRLVTVPRMLQRDPPRP